MMTFDSKIKSKKLFSFYLLLVLAFNHPLSGQNSGAYSDLFLGVENSSIVVSNAILVEYLYENDFQVPYLQNVEFRSSTNDFYLDQQDFAVRVRPNGIRQIKAQKKYHKAVIERAILEENSLINEELASRYTILLDYHVLPRFIINAMQLRDLFLKRIELVKQNAFSKDFNILSVVQAEEELFELELDILEYQQAWQQSKKAIQIILPHVDTLMGSWIEIEGIERFLNQSSVNNSISQSELDAELAIIEGEIQLEKTKANSILNFFQAEYSPRRNDDFFREEFSLSIGINLPMLGDKRVDVSELQFEALEEQQKYKLRIEAQVKESEELKHRIYNLIEKYKLIESLTSESQARYTLVNSRQRADVDPITIIKMQLILLEKRQSLKKMEYKIYEEYIDWLQVSGTLIQNPRTNFFHPEFKNF